MSKAMSTLYGGIAQLGECLTDWQSEGHGFEPRYLHHIFYTTIFAKNLLYKALQ